MTGSHGTPSRRSYEEQMHFMECQARMLAEDGNDVSASVMHQAQAMLAVEHARAEEATLQLGYMKAGVYQQQAKGWEEITRLLDEIAPGWSTSVEEYDGKTSIQRATEAIRRLSARSENAAFVLIAEEIAKARAKHPTWPANDTLFAAAIVAEESGELMRAAVQHKGEGGSLEACDKEAIQTAAVAIRFLERR